MREFIDKTNEQAGTPLNRNTMMAIQGFDDKVTTFSESQIIEKNGLGEVKRTVFNADGSITETYTGEKILIKTITFEENTVSEVIS